MATVGWGAISSGAFATSTPDTHDVEEASPQDVNPVITQKKSSKASVNLGYNPPYIPPAPAQLVQDEDPWAKKAKESELQKRESEIAKREQELQQREAQIQQAGGLIRKKNWPICYPLTFHDIRAEIPSENRRLVWYSYACWWGLVWCLSFNLFGACIMLGSGGANNVSSWFLALIYAILGIPLGFLLWYRTIYFGAQSNSSFAYCRFLVSFSVHLGFCIWAAIAVPFSAERWSFTGFVAAMSAFDQNTFVGVVYIIGAAFWTLESLASLWLIKEVYFGFRGQRNMMGNKPAAQFT